MSNLIKSQYINLHQQGKVIGWGTGFQSLASSVAEVMVDNEALDADNDSLLLKEEEERLVEKAERLLMDANEAAERMIEDAKKEAEAMRLAAVEEGRSSGYLDGMEQSQEELRNRRLQLEEEKNRLEKEYLQKAAELEPKFATVVIRLLEKLTGIMAEGHREIILHLISQGMAEAEKCKNFVIKVSSEEYRTVLESKDSILHGLPEGVNLQIYEDEDFARNQCLIEADGKMIDCSLDVQMQNLITQIKLLASM